MEAFPLWRPTVGQQFSLHHHCCILAAVCFFLFFLLLFTFDTWHYVFQNNPPMSPHSFPFISHCTKIPHTHNRNFQRMLFSYFNFVCFEGASSHTLGNRNHFTFFPRSFSLFFFFLSITVFYYLNGASFSVHKTTNFFCIVSLFCGGWKKKRIMEGDLQSNCIFQCLNIFIILSRSLLLRLQNAIQSKE